jgi:plastocyanin
MKKLLTLLLISLTFLANAQTGLLAGTGYAPDITVTDINGNTHNLYNYLDSGKVVVLELMSTTCGHCQSHASGTENSYQTNGPSGTNIARFLGLEVNAATDSAAVANFASTYGVTFPIANNVSPTAINYQLYYTPGYYVIYPDRSYTTICALYCVTAQNYSTIEGLLNAAIAAWQPTVYGCTDATACNYNPSANISDSSCIYQNNPIIDMTLSSWNLTIMDPECDGGGCWCNIIGGLPFSFNSSFEIYEYWSTGSYTIAGEWSLCGDTLTWVTPYSSSSAVFEVNASNISFGYCSGGYSNDPNVPADCCDFWVLNSVVYGCTDSTAFNYDPAATIDTGSCVPFIYGCMDSTAINYDPLANTSNDSCDYSSYVITTNGMSFSADTIVCDVGDTIVFILGGYHNAVEVSDSTWLAGGTTSNGGFNIGYGQIGMFIPDDCHTFYYVCQPHVSLGMKGVIIAHHPPVFGCTDLNANNYDSLATVDDGSCVYVAGCTDSTACNYDPLADVDDGSCEWTSCTGGICANDPISGLGVTDVLHNRATFTFDDMNTYDAMGVQVCRVDQLRIQYREVGTSSWSQKNMGSPTGYDPITGICNSTTNTAKLVLGLTSATTYEWRMKVWYCAIGNSGWVSAPSFTTLGDCPNVGNLTVTTPTTTKATFTWDDGNGPYSFVRIKARIDTNNAAWFNVGGVGVSYGTFTKDKNNLTPGTSYRAQARTWCDPNGGAYKSPTWTSLVYWTQPTVIRLEGGSAIANLAIYPNPSRDIFNVTFTSETIQELKVRILNLIGEELINEDLQQFIGDYTKQIDLATYPKGIYFLEVTTNDGIMNKKLILQ